MKNIIFIFNSYLIDKWQYDAICLLMQTNNVGIYIKHNEYIIKESFIIKVIKKFSSKRYSYNPKANIKVNILNLNKNYFVNEIPNVDLDIIINFTKNSFKLSSNIKQFIHFKFGRTGNLSSLGLLEIQNNDDLICTKINIQTRNSEKTFNIISEFNILAFERSINNHLYKLSLYLVRICSNSNINTVFFEYSKLKNNQIKSSEIIYIYSKKIILNILKNLFYNKNKKWTIRLIPRGKTLNDSIKLISPKNYFWADPFIYKNTNGYDLFIEEKRLDSKYGFISYLNIDNKGNILEHKPLIKENYHLSYPFIFKYKDTYYMVPESSMNKTIDLYICKKYPLEWEYVKTIMDNIIAVDTTLFEYNKTWWLFTNIKSTEGISVQDELFLFYSDSPLSSNWKAHPKNPIVSDIRKSRSAGRIFIDEKNRIIRPSQNSLKRYGYSINLNEILILNKQDYKEKILETIEPWDKNIEAVHTYNKCFNDIVIDCIE